MHTTKTIIRRLGVGGLAVALAVMLSSCISLRGDLTLDRQARASGDVTIEMAKQVAALAGITSVEAMRSQFQQSEQGQGLAQGDLDVSETDQAYRVTAKVSHQPMNDPTGFNATVTNNEISWSFRMGDPSASATTDEFGIGDTPLGSIDLTVHFPGKVISTSGPGISQPDDRTVRIQGQLTANSNSVWQVTSAIDPPSSTGPVLLIVAAVAVVAAAVGGLLLRRRRRSTEVPDTPADGPHGQEPAEPETAGPGSNTTRR